MAECHFKCMDVLIQMISIQNQNKSQFMVSAPIGTGGRGKTSRDSLVPSSSSEAQFRKDPKPITSAIVTSFSSTIPQPLYTSLSHVSSLGYRGIETPVIYAGLICMYCTRYVYCVLGRVYFILYLT